MSGQNDSVILELLKNSYSKMDSEVRIISSKSQQTNKFSIKNILGLNESAQEYKKSELNDNNSENYSIDVETVEQNEKIFHDKSSK